MLTPRRLVVALVAALALFLVVALWEGRRSTVEAPALPPPGGAGVGYPPPTLDMSLPYPPPTFGPTPYPPPLANTPTVVPAQAPTTVGAQGLRLHVSITPTTSATPIAPTPLQTPTVTITLTPPPRPSPTRTLRAVAPAEIAEPIFIESLRRKEPDAGDIEIVTVWADMPRFTRSTIRYRSEGQRVTGYLNIPKGNTGPYPAIVMNHGYFLQERYTPGMGTLREADYLAERGYVVAVTDFRSYAGSEAGRDGGGHFGVDWVYDSMNLMEAVKRHPVVDAQRLGVWGHSTGGLNALQATVARHDIRATVVVSTMSPEMSLTLGFLRNWRPWVADAVVKKFGAPQAAPQTWARMSPINYLKDASAPIQIHHGLADDEVNPQFSARLWEAMQKTGALGEYYTYAGADHLWQQPAQWRLMQERIFAFYERHLR